MLEMNSLKDNYIFRCFLYMKSKLKFNVCSIFLGVFIGVKR